MSTTEINQEACKKAEPQKEHEWLTKLVGDWTMEAECMMGPDQPPMKSKAKETVRSLGGLWIVAEGEGAMPDGAPALTMMSLGYDPQTKRYVGTWIGSMMTHMWVYDGEMSSSGTTLTLNAEGPDFLDTTKKAKYQDIIEIVSDDHRMLKSQVQGADGKWTHFMTANYHRVK
jgi:hypothetical protein